MKILTRVYKLPIVRFSSSFNGFQWNIPSKFNFAQDVIDAHAKDKGQKTAFHHVSVSGSTQKWSFQELSQESKNVAAALLSLGQIERALIVLPRIPQWWFLNIAAMRTGTILLPGTTQLTASDIESRLVMSKSDAIIVDIVGAKKVEQIQGRNLLKHKILVADETTSDLKSKGWILLQDLLEQPDNPACPSNLTNSSSDICQIFFTSGTTGAPKMCAHTHASYGFCHWVTGKYWLDLTSNDLHWNISDTGWAKSAWSNIFAPWSQAAGVFVHDMPRFEADKVLQVLKKEPVTTLCAPPTLYRSLIQLKNLSEFPNLRHCVSAGEPLNEEVMTAWYEKTGLWIYEGYGQTETTLLAATLKNMKVKPGSMGKAAPGYDVRIINDEGIEVSKGEEGNIAVFCDPNKEQGGLFAGYVDNQKLTEKAFLKHFYLTGDRGFMDNDDYIWFSSRQDDVIISAGYRIGPFEVESALLKHPAVMESAVVSSPDISRGAVVKAFIVLSPEFKARNADELVKEIQDHVKKTTAPYKYPRKIEFVDELPKTVSGKIRRTELRERELKRNSSKK